MANVKACYNSIWTWIILNTVLQLTEALLEVSLHVKPSPVRLTSTARLECKFRGHDNLQVQYIAWSKITFDGQRTFVYEYTSKCSDVLPTAHVSQGYNELNGRAVLQVVEPIGSNGQPAFMPILQQPSDWRERDILRQASLEVHQDSEKDAYYHSTGMDSLALPNQPKVGEGIAVLLINDVWFHDEAKYECLVKVHGEPASTDTVSLFIVVLPSVPVITVQGGPFEEGDNATLECSGNIGRPAGHLSWYRKRPSQEEYEKVDFDVTRSSVIHHDNGTSSGIIRTTVQLQASDDGLTFKCVASSRAMRPWEEKPYALSPMEVYYPPQKGKILFDAALNRYYCYAKASPPPEYVWLWIRKPIDETQEKENKDNEEYEHPDEEKDNGENKEVTEEDTIMSTNQYLDISSIHESGLFLFKCLASNVIGSVRHTEVMETQLRIMGTTTSTTTTTSPEPTVIHHTVIPKDYGIYSHLSTQRQELPSPEQYGIYSNIPAHLYHGETNENEVPVVAPPGDIIKYLDTNLGAKLPQYSTTESHDVYFDYHDSSHPNDIIKYLDSNVKGLGIYYDKIPTKNTEESANENLHYSPDPYEHKIYYAEKVEIPTTTVEPKKLDPEDPDDSSKVGAATVEIPITTRAFTQGVATRAIGGRTGGGRRAGGGGGGGFIGTPDYDDLEETILLNQETQSVRRVRIRPPVRAAQRSNKVQRKRPLLARRLKARQLAQRRQNLQRKMRQRRPGIVRPKPNVIPPLEPIPPITKHKMETYPMILPINQRKGARIKRKRKFLPKEAEKGSADTEPVADDVIYDEYFDSYEDEMRQPVESKSMETHLWPEEPLLGHNGTFNPDDLIDMHHVHMNDDVNSFSQNLEWYNNRDQENQEKMSNGAMLEDFVWRDYMPKYSLGVYDSPLYMQDGANQYIDPTVENAEYNYPWDYILNNDYYNEFTGPIEETYPDWTNDAPQQISKNEGNHNELHFMTDNLNVENPHHLEQETAWNEHYDNYEPDAYQNIEHENLVEQDVDSGEYTMKEHSKAGPLNSLTEALAMRIAQAKIFKQRPLLQLSNPPVPQSPAPVQHIIAQNPQILLPNKAPHALLPPNAIPNHTSRPKQTVNAAIHPNTIANPPLGFPAIPSNPNSAAPAISSEIITEASPKTYNCQNRPDGAYGGGCRAFYRCLGGKAFLVQCADGYVFHRHLAMCHQAVTAPPPCGKWRDCTQLPDGKYPDVEEGCKFYFTCQAKQFLGHNECNPGLIFNEYEQVCDWPRNVAPPCGRNTNNLQQQAA